jgi:hypothetical protein
MGYQFDSQSAWRILSTKPFPKNLEDNLVWMISREDDNPKQFFLCSVYRVSEIGNSGDDDFRFFAEGSGNYFEPHIRIADETWFPEFSKAVGHFGIGIQELKDQALIQELIASSQIDWLP